MVMSESVIRLSLTVDRGLSMLGSRRRNVQTPDQKALFDH